MPQFDLILFDANRRQINFAPCLVNGFDLEAVSPQIRNEIEKYPLGDVTSVMVYDNHGEFAARYTIQDYLLGNIPKQNKSKKKAWHVNLNRLSSCPMKIKFGYRPNGLFVMRFSFKPLKTKRIVLPSGLVLVMKN